MSASFTTGRITGIWQELLDFQKSFKIKGPQIQTGVRKPQK